MPILQLDTAERHQLSPTLLKRASSLKNSLSSPQSRTTKIFDSLSPRLHSPAKQLQTSLIKIRISKFIGELQRKQHLGETLAPPSSSTSLGAINLRYNSPAIFSLSPKIEALTELESLSSEWLLAPELERATAKKEPEIAPRHPCLHSKADAYVPSKKETYVPPHKRKRSGVRPANVDWRTGELMAEPVMQPVLRLVPWFHTLTKEQKQDHNRQCAERRVLKKLQKQARMQQEV